MTMSLRVVSKENYRRWRWSKISSQDHIKPCHLWFKKKERKEWNEQKLPKVLPGDSGGRLPGRSTIGKRQRRIGTVDDEGERRKEKSGVKSPKKWLRASRVREQEDAMTLSRRPYIEQLGKGSCKIGTARISKIEE